MAVNFNKVTRGYAVTLAPAGKFPIVGDRIFATLAEAQAYVDKANGTAIPGISLSVIADGNNNGAYWVAQAAGYDGATVGILQKMWEGGGTPSGGSLSADAIISALGYTPFDSDAFTKENIKNALGIADWALAASKPSYTWTEIGSRPTALSAFTNDLGLGSLAYKSSLVASDIPSLPWSKITSGKPTTLSGYGITDAILYEGAIDLSSAYRSMGYGYASKGWKTSGPAAVFGTALYNLRMQCAIGTTDTPYVYVSQMYNGEAKGWAELVTYEGAKGRVFYAGQYWIGDTAVLHRSGNDTFLNYGNRTTGDLYLYGKNLRFSIDGGSSYSLRILNDGSLLIHDIALTKGTSNALKAGAYEALNYFADGKLIMHRNAGVANFFLNYGGAGEPLYAYASEYGFHIGASRERAVTIDANKNASFAANLTVSGLLNSANFMAGGSILSDPTSSFQSSIFGSTDSSFRIRTMRSGIAVDRFTAVYAPMLTIKTNDTHAFISIGYNTAGKSKCYIGAGIGDAVSWSGILFHDNMDLIPKDDGVFYLGYSDKRWRTLNAVNVSADGIYGYVPEGGTYQRYRLISSDDTMYLQVGAQDGTARTGKLTISGINVAVLLSLTIYSQQTLFSGAVQVNGTSRFVSLATFDTGLKIGDATLTWDASAGMLKIDKGVYSIGAITAGGKGQSNKYRLDNWTEWDASDNKWQESSLSAKLGVDLHTRLLAIEESANLGPVKIDLEYIRNTTTLTPSQALTAGLTEDVINNMLAGKYTKVIPDNDAKEVWDYTADGSGNSISIYLSNGDGFTLKSGIVIHRDSITDNWSVTYDEI